MFPSIEACTAIATDVWSLAAASTMAVDALWAEVGAEQLADRRNAVVFCRADADGGLREPRLLSASSGPPQLPLATAVRTEQVQLPR